ncbi:aggregation-promoting factor C-terminal-like domain-containing protein [Limosilactobacillus reuteri]
MKQAGIPESWYDSINYIVTHESGWRVNATNPSSGAYGLPQSLPGSKMAAAGRDWRTNPITQLKWMKSYVGRYGGGPGAAAFWRAHHWYANGGLVDKEQLIHISEGNRPEMIIPLSASKRGRAYQLLGEVVARFKHEDGQAQPTRDDQSISRKEFMSLESKLDQLISGVQQLVQVGHQQIDATVNSGNKFGMKANRLSAYTTMAKDQRLNDFMSYKR